ncbi:MAG TPA: GNAT family N-acetyltransferase [Acidimicrobiales bacterium]|nr:GNAT family N-acetyltransferase [Acidimicrobiales bacterium]
MPPQHDDPSTDVDVRDYRDGDYQACRHLWVELTEHHRRLFDDPTIGGEDPGAGLDRYLADPERAASWVAEVAGEVVGLTGLLHHGSSGEVEPVVVAEARRGGGIGRALIARVVDEAVSRGYEYLAIRPVARNASAIRAFHSTGFRTLGGHVDLTMDLKPRRHRPLGSVGLHGVELQY